MPLPPLSRLLPVTSLIAACGAGSAPLSPFGSVHSELSPLGEACVLDDDAFPALVVTRTEVPSVLAVSWVDTGADRAWVEFVGEDGEARSTDVVLGGAEPRFFLLGLHGGEAVRVVARSEGDGVSRCAAPVEAATGTFSSALPVLSFEGDAIPDYTSAVLFQEDRNWAVVFDGEGRLVYAWALASNAFRARFARDGSGLLVNPVDERGLGTLVHLGWDGTETQLVAPGNLHTDFVELEDGRLATIASEVRTLTHDGETFLVRGESIQVQQEPGGALVERWNAFDLFPPDLERLYSPDAYGVQDWTHGNGLSYAEDLGRFAISLPGIEAVAGVDLETGATTWLASSATLPAGSTTEQPGAIASPHSVYELDGDDFVVFNRRLGEDQCSEVAWLRLDASSGVAVTTGTYPGQECLSVPYLGEAQLLDDGGTLISWTTAGVLERIDAERQPTWTLRSALGAAFGFTDVTEDLYAGAGALRDGPDL
jgi:hypothetical protein